MGNPFDALDKANDMVKEMEKAKDELDRQVVAESQKRIDESWDKIREANANAPAGEKAGPIPSQVGDDGFTPKTDPSNTPGDQGFTPKTDATNGPGDAGFTPKATNTNDAIPQDFVDAIKRETGIGNQAGTGTVGDAIADAGKDVLDDLNSRSPSDLEESRSQNTQPTGDTTDGENSRDDFTPSEDAQWNNEYGQQPQTSFGSDDFTPTEDAAWNQQYGDGDATQLPEADGFTPSEDAQWNDAYAPDTGMEQEQAAEADAAYDESGF